MALRDEENKLRDEEDKLRDKEIALLELKLSTFFDPSHILSVYL